MTQIHRYTRRRTLAWAAGAASAASASHWPATLWAQNASHWPSVEAQARGQQVFFNAWGGSDRVNAYIQWAAAQIKQSHGVQVEHVKLTDTAEAVKRVRGEKAAGKLTGGSVDMLWINGENFLTMKRETLLYGPFAEDLPNFRYVDVVGKPSTRVDFSEPVQGFEAPWGMAQFTLFADARRVPKPPQSMVELAQFARAHPGRVTYPRPPQFMGTTFLKQVLLELHPTAQARQALYQSATPEALDRLCAPLWAYLDALHPHLWRGGKQFPASPTAQRQMMADGELLIALTFNPNEAANEIAAGHLADSVFSWQLPAGTLGNTHFLAIPFNSSASAGARVFINFLLSPQAQARKADLAVWGDPSVLTTSALAAAHQASASPEAARLRPGQVQQTAPVLLEPHGSWVEPLERLWLRRYGA